MASIVTQLVEPLPLVLLESHMEMFKFWSSFAARLLGKQWKVTQVLRHLPPTWKIGRQFCVPGFTWPRLSHCDDLESGPTNGFFSLIFSNLRTVLVSISRNTMLGNWNWEDSSSVRKWDNMKEWSCYHFILCKWRKC